MARILYGPLVTAIKGSIGGVTFQGNPSGSIIRSRPHLSKSSTAKQTTAHVGLQKLLYEWQNITPTNRTDWNTFALANPKINKFGQSKQLTGLQWFTSANWWTNYLSSTIQSSPPAFATAEAPPTFTVEIGDIDLLLDLVAGINYDVSALIVWATSPTKKNSLSLNQVRKLVTVYSDDPGLELDIASTWATAIGIPYTPPTLFPHANIFVCMQTVLKASGITSPISCVRGSWL